MTTTILCLVLALLLVFALTAWLDQKSRADVLAEMIKQQPVSRRGGSNG